MDGSWLASGATQALNVLNPASAEVLAEVPMSPADEVNRAARPRPGFSGLGAERRPAIASSRCSSSRHCSRATTTTSRAPSPEECGKTLRRECRRRCAVPSKT